MGPIKRQNKGFSSKGQALIEYVVYIAMVAFVFFALFMRSNLKGTILSRWRKDILSIGEFQYSPSATTEVVPYNVQLTQDTMTDLQGFGSGTLSTGGSPYRAHRDTF